MLSSAGTRALLEIVIHEGRNRQVRRMCEAIGHPVRSLARTHIGPLHDAKLGPGEIRSAETRADKEQGDRQTVINEANAAQQSRATLMNMTNEAGNFTQGPFAQYKQAASRYLRLIDPSYDGQVASYEDFVKNAGSLTRPFPVRSISAHRSR